ncbi:hypothetical protein [Streptacidiphilus sp. P02-A3a]|uniref:hypothetical protein n=1 Tax=Streptacidiphilus sp. P02-A3a TaxID=2704468 RepID=UPI0015FC5E6C|nr:hypothetical protein [Streptacidiphilus sp. P02-A3a]QMU71056.1 hypothetical protein GXP74_25365 [Streptacidiphilus sp. P02-A3a]
MRQISKATAVAAAAFAAVVGFGTTQASAATTWTVSGGTSFKATATSPTLKDTSTSATLNCTSSAAAGTAVNGSGLSGTGLASITSVSWVSCTGPLGITFTVTPKNLPWSLNATSYNSSTGTTTGTLSGVEASISGTLCSASFAGTSATTPATLNATYVNSTHTLSISGGNLHAWGVSGCLGLINNGDAATYTAAYVVTPALTITSP